jgi:hypothetical protein
VGGIRNSEYNTVIDVAALFIVQKVHFVWLETFSAASRTCNDLEPAQVFCASGNLLKDNCIIRWLREFRRVCKVCIYN